MTMRLRGGYGTGRGFIGSGMTKHLGTVALSSWTKAGRPE